MKYYGGIALVVVAMIVVALVLRHGTGNKRSSTSTRSAATTTHVSSASSSTNQPGASSTRKSSSTTKKASGSSSLTEVAASELPPEAQHTLDLVASNGPFPYSRDGVVFSNFDGLLPKQKSGYYHEYTVVTPGSKDRGARRVIAGKNGEHYYTDDHYASFRLIIDG